METRYGDWTVLEFKAGHKWLCRCTCGVVKEVNKQNLQRGYSKGCGCEAIKRMHAAGKIRATTHGMSKSATYRAWVEMRRRCTDPNRTYHAHYIDRGIKVCDRWLNSFENFLADMGERPAKGYSIDRIDNDGNYEPGNCRWATLVEQARNMSSNRYVTVDGERMLVVEASLKYGINQKSAHTRLRKGWDHDRVFKQPIKGHYSSGSSGAT